jgi:hypothetical protein
MRPVTPAMISAVMCGFGSAESEAQASQERVEDSLLGGI